ncbi:hypothetical protein HanIR_Chr16g0824591 [Helianthus annuus]|nr:hypothetical protein HanIR_Chr16g0824591 [Helianthus annuus]
MMNSMQRKLSLALKMVRYKNTRLGPRSQSVSRYKRMLVSESQASQDQERGDEG